MKTTKEHFELFKKECLFWIEKLKLDNWEVCFKHKTVSVGSFGSCHSKLSGRVSTLFFCNNWDDSVKELSEEEIKKTAKHEVIHLLLSRFSTLAYLRHTTEDELYEAEEELVRKLEKIIK